MASSSNGNDLRPQKVRKGTHSCRECRRRKVKCIYLSPADAVCVVCRQRGARCISQFADVHDNRHRRSDTTPHATSTSDTRSEIRFGGDDSTYMSWTGASEDSTTASQTPATDTGTSSSNVHSASQNSIPSKAVAKSITIIQQRKQQSMMQSLLDVLPSPTEISILYDNVKRLSGLRYQHYSYSRCDSSLSAGIPGERSFTPNLLHPHEHPILLARQMLYFAAALQTIPSREAITGHTKHHRAIMDDVASAAIKIVTTNDELLGTVEGLETIFLEALFHIECGNIRRAWTTMRRCVSVAQLMSLDRRDRARYKTIQDSLDVDIDAMWYSIICTERILSLLLGLPTSTAGVKLPHSKKAGMPLGSVVVKILERNDTKTAREANDFTLEIDRELIQIAEDMLSSFWRPAALTGLMPGSLDAMAEARRLFEHMCYYTLVIQLHLPHMLSPSDDVQTRHYSKIACVTASREILTRQIALRRIESVLIWRPMSDFVALIAGMTLLLAHATSHCGRRTDNVLAHQRSSDRATVGQALQCMEPASDLHEDVLAANCAAVLMDLLKIEADAARERREPEGQCREVGSDVEYSHSIWIMRVPYLGAIRISRTGVSAVPPERVANGQCLHTNVTLGGIGSISVIRTRPQDEDISTRACESTTSWHGSSSTANTAAIPLGVPDPPHFALDTLLLPNEDMFPDATAGVDDWMFQGLDTAYFDILLRGLDTT